MTNCCTCTDFCAPHLPLDTWREIMCHNPFYFWQLAQPKIDNPGTPIPDDHNPCNPLAYKKGWQQGTVGRDEVYDAIIAAERQFAEFTGHYAFPTYDCHEEAYYCTRYSNERIRIRLPMRKVIEIGSEVLTLLQTVNLPDEAFSDRDGDGVIDWVEFTVPDETVEGLTLFFTEPDWCDKPLCRNEIAPICFEQNGADVDVSGHSWLFVRPILYGNVKTKALDPNNLDIYASEVYLYRRSTVADVRILTRPGGCSCGNDEACYIAEDAELCIINGEQGVVELRTNSCICPVCVDKVCVNYLSGGCDYDRIIARLAAANLGRDVCCCENAEVAYWMQDFVGVDSRGRIATPLSAVEMANFFGTRRGQLEAYKLLRRRKAPRIARM